MPRRPHNAEFERDFKIPASTSPANTTPATTTPATTTPANEPVPLDPDAPRYVIEEIEIDDGDARDETRTPGSVMLFLAVAFGIVVAAYLLF